MNGRYASSFDSTYEGLKPGAGFTRGLRSRGFDSTYEGLKRGWPVAGECFDSTYEGLKRHQRVPASPATGRFDSTYEGLKRCGRGDRQQPVRRFRQYL